MTPPPLTHERLVELPANPWRSSATPVSISINPACRLRQLPADWRTEPATLLPSNPVKKERDNYSALHRFSAQIRSRWVLRAKTPPTPNDRGRVRHKNMESCGLVTLRNTWMLSSFQRQHSGQRCHLSMMTGG